MVLKQASHRCPWGLSDTAATLLGGYMSQDFSKSPGLVPPCLAGYLTPFCPRRTVLVESSDYNNKPGGGSQPVPSTQCWPGFVNDTYSYESTYLACVGTWPTTALVLLLYTY